MKDKNRNLSRGKKNKSMFDKLLDEWNLEVNEFADLLGIHRVTLWQYRRGKREFRLSMEQFHKLQKLLKEINKDIFELPLDWYLDKDQDEQTWDEPKGKN